jgi:uncharacterized membrane protein
MNQNSAATSTTTLTGSNRDPDGGARRDWLLVLGFICVSMAIRLHGLSAANIWLDEANSWQVASGSWSNMLGELRGSPVGPLYFILLKPWIGVTGETAFALRAFSVLASVVLIAVVYALGAKILSRRAALLASAMVALSPLELYFAQEARMYLLTSLAAALCLWAYARWRRDAVASWRTSPAAPAASMTLLGSLAWYVLAALTLLFTHPVAGTLLVAINVDALVVYWRTRASPSASSSASRRRMLISWIAAQLAIGAVIVAYLAFLRLDTAASSQAWRSPLGPEGALRAALLLPFNAIAGQRYYPADFWLAFNDLTQHRGSFGRFLLLLVVQPLTLIVFVLAAEAGFRVRWGARHDVGASSTIDSGRRLLLLALTIPLAIGAVISVNRGLEMDRYFLFVVPFFLLLLADGLLALEYRVRCAAVAVLAVAMILGTRSTKKDVSRDSDYRNTASMIDRDRRPNDRIVIQPREMNAPLRFYLRSRADSIIGLAADAQAGRELAKLSPGRTWVVLDYRSPLYVLAPQELADALAAPVERDVYTSDTSVGVRVALVNTASGSR